MAEAEAKAADTEAKAKAEKIAIGKQLLNEMSVESVCKITGLSKEKLQIEEVLNSR